MGILDQLQHEMIKAGGVIRDFPVARLARVEKEWVNTESTLLARSALRADMLAHYFDFSIVHDKSIRTLFIAAFPSPPLYVTFHMEGEAFDVSLPPIYGNRGNVLSQSKAITDKVLTPVGLTALPVVLPKKPIAVLSGLGQYGRNNLVYVKGMGTCHRLVLFASDAEPSGSPLSKVVRMEACDTCGICRTQCPTGAIRSDRDLIDADRCLSFLNERPGDLPAWMEPDGHNSLVGCDRCQARCPENRHVWARTRAAVFDATETSLIERGVPFTELDGRLQMKLNNLSLDIYYPVLGRNLRALYS